MKKLQNAAILFEKAEDFAGVGLINHQIGSVYIEETDYESACRFYLEAIKGYTTAMHKFHPQRKSYWSLSSNLKKTIADLKNQILEMTEKLDSTETREKIKLDVEKL